MTDRHGKKSANNPVKKGSGKAVKAYTGGPNCRHCKMLNEGCGYLVDGSVICRYLHAKEKTPGK